MKPDTTSYEDGIPLDTGELDRIERIFEITGYSGLTEDDFDFLNEVINRLIRGTNELKKQGG
jgi:hypothetical protein